MNVDRIATHGSVVFLGMVVTTFCVVSLTYALPAPGLAQGRIVLDTTKSPQDFRIQVLGTPVQIIPDHEGVFEVSDFLPGSVLDVMVWDTQGEYVRRHQTLFVASPNQPQPWYEIAPGRQTLMAELQTLSPSTSASQKSSLCGQVILEPKNLLQKTQLSLRPWSVLTAPVFPLLYNDSWLPDPTQHVFTNNGFFCFSALPSSPVKDFYELSLKNPFHGIDIRYRLFVPAYSFEYDVVFDIDAVLWRPLMVRQSDDLFLYKEDLFPFPLTQELIELPAVGNLNEESLGAQHFVLIPRSALITPIVEQELQEPFEPGRFYTDTTSPPVTLKLPPTWNTFAPENSKLGSAFVSLHFEPLGFTADDFVFIDLYNAQGVSVEHLFTVDETSPTLFQGFFENLPLGRHWLVISTEDGQPLWIFPVDSLPEKTQIIVASDQNF